MPITTYRVQNNTAHNIQHNVKESSVSEEPTTVNRLMLKALLLDTITRIKFGSTLAPNSNGAKYTFLRAIGVNKKRVRNMDLMYYIGSVYRDNQLLSEYNGTVKKFGLDLYTIQDTSI